MDIEGDLNLGLKNYALQIMGYQNSATDYNTEAPMDYLLENSSLPEEQCREDIEILEEGGFLERRHRPVQRVQTYNGDFASLGPDTEVRITEEGQEFIETHHWDNLAESAQDINFKRDVLQAGT